MKKLFMLLALVLGVVSCQTEPEGFDVVVGGEQDVNITVSLPDETRAGSDKGFDLSKLSDLGYELRYILEIYLNDDDDSNNGKWFRAVETSNTTSATFPVRLAPNKVYTFTVWADLVKEGTETDLFYNTTDLKNITLKSDVDAEIAKVVELRDAYTHTDTFNFTNEREKLNMTLTRPFAKVRVVATDLADVTKFGIIPANADVVYTSDIHTSFNAVAGDVNANEIVKPTFDYNIVANNYDEVDEQKQLTVFADYIFVPKSGSTVQFSLDIKTGTERIKLNNFNTAIPVERNKVTSIVGDVLTQGENIDVDINTGFDGNTTKYIGTINETIELTEGQYIFDNLTVNTTSTNAVVIAENANVTIDIIGDVTLKSAGSARDAILVPATATLTINGVVAQTRSAERAGKLVVEATDGSAISGSVTINNLAGLTAKGNGNHAFGIGGTNAEVTINNTKVDYVAGGHIQPLFVNDTDYGKSEPEGGAAIGGKKVVIENSEIVKAEGGSKAAAIGNSYWSSTEVVINNSQLGDIFGGNASAAIGGSRYSSDKTTHHSVKVAIENSTITKAVGGQFGAGIGSGYDTHCLAGGEGSTAVNDITIKTSTITAQGGKYAAGIGTGFHAAALTGSIDAQSTINATAGKGFYKDKYTHAQNIGYGIVDPNREFANGVVTFTVANEVIEEPKKAVAEGIVMEDETYLILNADGLKWFADKVNSFEMINASVALANDIDLSGIEWTPISMSTNLANKENFRGTFDGRNHTISGLTVNQPEVAGLFGYVYAATIKNVTVKNANINSNHYAGGIVAWVLNNRGNIQVPFVMENCHVEDSTITSAAIEIDGAWDNGDKVGGLVGYVDFGDPGNEGAVIKNCSVKNTSIKAYRDFAGLVGYASNVTLQGCTTENVTLEQDLNHDYKAPNTPTTFGMIIGRSEGTNIVDGYQYVADGLYKDGKAYIVKSAQGLVALSSMTIAGGESVKLGADIDLKDVEFNGLNAFNPENNNTFDGQGHTVSNWIYTGRADDMGFIRNWVGPIKNLTIKKAVLRTGGRSAVIAAKPYGNIENCHVVDCNLQSNWWACGLIAGMHNSGNIKDCSATSSYIKSTGGTAAITGVLNETDGTRTFTNCIVTGCTINCTNGNAAEPWYAGGAIVGMVNLDYSTIEFNNCQTENNTFKGEFSNDSYYGYSFSPVKINGASVINTAEELTAAIASNNAVIIGADIEDATIKLPAELSNFTLRAAKGVSLKNTTISTADGNAYHYENLTFDGITFDNSRIVLTGWRNGEEVIKNLTVTNCVFKNIDDTTNSAAVHINKDASEAVENFTFTNNVIDGATGGSKSGVYAQVTGKVVFENNVINNVSFRPYVIQITTDDAIADTFTVRGNTFSGSSVGRAQGLGNNAEGTDVVELVVSGNIFKDITDSQQICYWNFNPATTTADLSKNYYSIDIEANPSRIYYNAAAASVEDLKAMGVFPYYTALNADGTIDLSSLKQAE